MGGAGPTEKSRETPTAERSGVAGRCKTTRRGVLCRQQLHAHKPQHNISQDNNSQSTEFREQLHIAATRHRRRVVSVGLRHSLFF